MSAQDYELRAWLGDGWTEQQIEQIITEYRAAEHLTRGDEQEDEALLVAIAQRVDGTLDREELARDFHAARARELETRTAAMAAVRAEVTAGVLNESEAKRAYGVDRMTVRAWLGKKR